MESIKDMDRRSMTFALTHLYYAMLELHGGEVVDMCLSAYMCKWNDNHPYEEISYADLDEVLKFWHDKDLFGEM